MKFSTPYLPMNLPSSSMHGPDNQVIQQGYQVTAFKNYNRVTSCRAITSLSIFRTSPTNKKQQRSVKRKSPTMQIGVNHYSSNKGENSGRKLIKAPASY